MKLTSTPEAPCRSYFARRLSSANTWEGANDGVSKASKQTKPSPEGS